MSCNLCSCVQYGSDGNLYGRNYDAESNDVDNYNANTLLTILKMLMNDSYLSITISRVTGKFKKKITQ